MYAELGKRTVIGCQSMQTLAAVQLILLPQDPFQSGCLPVVVWSASARAMH